MLLIAIPTYRMIDVTLASVSQNSTVQEGRKG